MSNIYKIFLIALMLPAFNSKLSAQPYPWPINSPNAEHRIFGGYGEYENTSDLGVYMHEGLDLIGAVGTPVIAVCNGRIVEKYFSTNGPRNRSLRLGVSTDANLSNIPYAFWYLHIEIGNNRNFSRPWQVGDLVHVGDTLGTISNFGITSHMHFEYDNKENPNSWQPTKDSLDADEYADFADIQANPITVLTPVVDNVHPQIDTAIYCRKGEEDGGFDHVYFSTRTASGKKVIKEDIDMIVAAADSFSSFQQNFLINVLKIEHKVTEVAGNSGYDYQKLIDFSGGFLRNDKPDSARNSYKKIRPPLGTAFAETIYENQDNTCNSIARNTLDSTNVFPRKYFYVLTNIDTGNAYTLQIDDAAYYWDTKALCAPGAKWNWNNVSSGGQAQDNKSALFPDGLYTVKVRATGYGGIADTSTMEYTLFVNNFDEKIFSCDFSGNDRDTFCTGETVYLKGEGFPKDRTFRAYVMKDTIWNDNKLIPNDPSRVNSVDVSSDANGNILPTVIWDSYIPNGNPDKGYAILLDYEGDSMYTGKREGHTIDVKDTSIAGRKAITGRQVIEKEISYQYCNPNNCMASVKYNIHGGIPPYDIYLDFNYSGRDSVVYIDSLCPGTYIVTIIDSICTMNDTLVIEPTIPLMVHCFHAGIPPCGQPGNNEIGVSIVGGVQPYVIHWSSGDTSMIVQNVSNGTYFVTVTDSSGCVHSDSIMVFTPDSIRIHPDIIPVNCVDNGEIHLNITGGSGYYNITWYTPSNYYQAGTADLVNLFDTGNYVVYINDYFNCNFLDTIHLTGNPHYIPYSIGGYIDCKPTPAIYFNVIGPGSFTYSWTGPHGFTAFTQYPDTLIYPGYYIVNVSDGLGCSSTDSIYVDGHPPVFVSSVVTPMNCEVLGEINITPSIGTPPFTYTWSTAFGYMSQQEDLTNLIVAGNYFLKITDAAGCTVRDTILFTGRQRVRLFGLTSPVNCGANGAVTIFPLSGSPPFQYSWIGPNNFTSVNQNLTGLTIPGSYIVTTTSLNGCMHVDTFNVTGNSAITLSSVVLPMTCGLDGEIDMTVNGGVPPFTYSWVGPGGFQSVVKDISSLTMAGAYTVTVTGASGCTATLSSILSGSPAVSCNATSTPINCNIPGTISGIVGNGTPGYTFLWTGPNNLSINNQNLFNLVTPGQYHLKVTDSNGCICEHDETLTGSVAISSCALVFTPLSCTSPGAVNATVIGGTNPFSYDWNGPGGYFSTSQNISGLTVMGIYSFTVTDVNGCTCSSSGVLGGVQPISCSAGSTSISCASSGSLSSTTSGGTPPIQFHWTGPGGFSSNSQNVSGITVAGTYNLMVQDANNCVCNKSVLVNSSGGFSCNILVTNISCHGENDGSMTANIVGGLSPFSFLWSNSSVLQTINNISAGNYSVVVTDANNCTASAASVVIDPPLLVVSISGDDTICDGDSLLLGSLSSGGTGTIVNSWTGPDNFTSGNQNILILNSTGTQSGIYKITVTDLDGCTASDSQLVVINQCTSEILLNSKIFIEGYYIGGGLMRAVINSITYPVICDTILVSLASNAFPFIELYSDKTLIHTNGEVTAHFPINILNQSFYLVLHHRNALETWSAAPVLFDSTVVNYLFSISASQAFGNNLKNLGDGNFALYSGDINKNGIIDDEDFDEVETAAMLFLYGYYPEDLTGDDIVESADFSLIENNAILFLVLMRP